ncbi:YpmS family protein [Bacillus sp. JCM 19034]|uniref:YpmS family protein n=1 Tax=Bacillus sp. JCM 19034 TaxID=1481928 RepID=UPI0007839D75|nr:YpmS family protein [Bacillus sp. JCM 19034]
MANEGKKWKVAFYTLLTFMISIFIVIVLLVRMFPSVDGESYETKPFSNNEALFTIETDKQRFTYFINSLLKENESEVPYVIELGDEYVEFRSLFHLFGQEIPIQIYFDPTVEPNGDLLLRVDSFQLGVFSLPVDRMMMLLQEMLDLADWVVFYPVDELVELKMTELPLDELGKMHLRFKTFNLQEDLLEMELYFN